MKKRGYAVLILSLPLWGMQPPDPAGARAKIKQAKLLLLTGQADEARLLFQRAQRAAFFESSPLRQAHAYIWSGFCRLRLGARNMVAYEDIMRYFQAAYNVSPDEHLKEVAEILMQFTSEFYYPEKTSCKAVIITANESNARALRKRITFYATQWAEQQERQKELLRHKSSKK